MKKRIAAMLLAAVMVFNIIGDNARPARAFAPAVAAAIPSFVAVVYGVMTGCFDECAEALGYCLQAAADGVEVTADFLGDCFVGDEDTPSWFVTGWCQISNTVGSWLDSGEVELSEDGKIYMNYYQYLELCTQMYDYVDMSLDLGSALEHGILSTPFNQAIPCSTVSKPESFYTSSGCSYAPIYYSDTDIYISQLYFLGLDWTSASGSNSHYFSPVQPSGSWYLSISGGSSYAHWCEIFSPSFLYSSVDNNCYFNYTLGVNKDPYVWNLKASNWWYYDSATGSVTSIDHSEVDTTLSQGYLMTEGYTKDFIKTITEISAAPDTSQIDDLSDPLDDVLVLNPNPGLVVDTDPSITVPTDAILITDVPAVDDMTLTQAMEDAKPRLDMEVPSSILNKFPFSLPFDFYRLLTIFAAEPKAPVFRIPISNVNVDMSAFEGNQTLGQFADGETTELMFEIDEEIVIDLSNIPYIQPISHAIFIVSFIALLIFVTTKLIHH